MIKAVLFDYDGVMTLDKSGSYTTCKYVSAKTGVDYELFSQEYRKYDGDLLIGKTTHEAIWQALCASVGRELGIRYLFESYRNAPLNEKMYELARKLKRTYKTGLITDNPKDRIDAVRRYQKLDEIFTVINVSAEVGSGKDKEEIFKKTTRELGVAADECVFIDNQEKNLIVPKRLGMATIFHDQKENDIKALIAALKKNNVEI
jgi:putative hydrolase of the HAD superfamily